MKTTKRVRIAAHRFLIGLGVDTRKRRTDREFLENRVFPAMLSDGTIQRILFVGVAWYTLHYPRLFSKRDFVTLEIDPAEACYGAAEHIIDSCENVQHHFPPGSLDAIVFNGIFGFGLNDKEVANRTLEAFACVLRPSGLFVLGWNDAPDTTPFRPSELSALALFEHCELIAGHGAIVKSGERNGHQFEFFRRRV